MALDSRIDGWTVDQIPAGDEPIPVQNNAGTNRVITPDGIAHRSALAPYFYGFAASSDPAAGQSISAGSNPQSYPNTLLNSVGAAWDETNYDFTIPAGNSGMWSFNFFIVISNISSTGSKKNFSMGLIAMVDGIQSGGDQIILAKDDLSLMPNLTLNAQFMAFMAAGTVVSIQAETNVDGTLNFDFDGNGFRAQYLGTA